MAEPRRLLAHRVALAPGLSRSMRMLGDATPWGTGETETGW